MKRILLITLTALLWSSLSFGQSQRTVLFEHFTGASCPPCAYWNPQINNLIGPIDHKVIMLRYQLAPPGIDPMYSHNPQHSAMRFIYYNGSGIPHSAVDGNHFVGYPSGLNVNTFNQRHNVPSPFDIDIVYEVGIEHIKANVTVTATQNVSGASLVLHTVVMEERIAFATSPGSNGEKVFDHVMKRMLPSAEGTIIPANWSQGASFTYTHTWNHTNVYKLTELGVVAFIQNTATKEVYQAAVNTDAIYVSPYEIGVAPLEVTNLPSSICTGTQQGVNPTVKVKNFGTETITNLDVVATVDGVDHTTSWQGTLGIWDEAQISLNELNINATGSSNQIEIKVVNTNGSNNELASDVLTNTISNGNMIANPSLNLELTFHCFPETTRWELQDPSNGEIIQQGGPYSFVGPNSNHTFPITLALDACHVFNLYSTDGSGLNGTSIAGCFGDGSATLTDELGTVLYSNNGSYPFQVESTSFRADLSLSDGIRTNEKVDFRMFPNPSSGITTLQFELNTPERVSYEVISLLGQVVKMKDLGMLPAGAMLVTSDLSELNPGIYMVNVRYGDQLFTKKLMLRK